MKYFYIFIFIVVAGCCFNSKEAHDKKHIIKVINFDISPDEEKIAFSALTPVGNIDIWVVDINGINLKKLTFKDRSLANHIARFFKKYNLTDYFEIDMHSPKWTKDGRILFCQRLTRHTLWDAYTVSLKIFTIKTDGTDMKAEVNMDEVIKKETRSPINIFKTVEFSKKYKKKIFLRNDNLWYLDENNNAPRLLIQ